ncbi:hypothetical protein BVC80_205g75 [Macleaya cordata]|uniref:Reverse transcriptase zinc-binding domain n=1 Tax=Macleaya cordata TaxID=56857 RepID=A0A200PZ24_MACCD|nr:hypothetical protein BVC80_205g75 [Macleaya cordata]
MKEKSISEAYQNGGEWKLGIDRRLYKVEIGELTELLGLLGEVNLTEEDDRIWWKNDKKGNFSVAACYAESDAIENLKFPSKISWKLKGLSDRGKILWRVLPASICWGIWKARNRVAFEGKDVKPEELINDIKVQAFFWVQGKEEFRGVSIDQIIGRWSYFFRDLN